MADDSDVPRPTWLVPSLALVLLAASVFVAPPSGTPGTGAAGRSPPPAAPRRAAAIPPGSIAYTRDYGELHLVQPDATGDRVIWTEPTGPNNGLFQSAWRPDSAEVAYVSSHEHATSLYQDDFYGVQPDGTSPRRISYSRTLSSSAATRPVRSWSPS